MSSTVASPEVLSNATACVGDYCRLLVTEGLTTLEYGVTLLLMATIITAAILNNTCVIYVIMRTPHLRRQLSYVFVLNLCVTDVMATVLVLPFMVISFTQGHWPFQEPYCLAQGFLVSFFIILSTTSICTISIDRLYSIKSLMHYAANMTLGRVMNVIITVWIYAIVIALVPIFDRDSYLFQKSKMYCFFEWSAGWNHSSYIIAFSVLGFIIPCIVVVIMYIVIYRVARKTATQIRPMQTRFCCRQPLDPEEAPGNEDFFEFLERTSIAQLRQTGSPNLLVAPWRSSVVRHM